MLMGTNHATIYIMHFPLDLAVSVLDLLASSKDAIPYPTLLPAIKATGNGLPLPITLWQIPPGRSRLQNPDNPVDDRPMIEV